MLTRVAQHADDREPTEMTHRRQMITALGIGAGLAAVSRSSAQGVSSPKILVESFAATLTAHDMVAFADLLWDDYVNHQVSAAAPIPAGKTAKELTVALFSARLAAMPDLRVSVEAVVADADRVAASFVYTGTHRGPYFGVAPTGKALRFTSCDIFEVRGGRLAEHWGMGDIAGIMAQLKA